MSDEGSGNDASEDANNDMVSQSKNQNVMRESRNTTGYTYQNNQPINYESDGIAGI